MAVRPLQPADLPYLYAVFQDVTSSLPHGFPATREEFFASISATPAHHRIGRVLVVSTGGEPSGFARTGIYRSVADRWSFAKPGEGLLFGPFVRTAEVAAGEALLTACVAYLRSQGAGRCLAFDPVEAVGAPFYNGGWSGLSERLPHLATLLSQFGFRIRYREFCLFKSSLADLPAPGAIPESLTLSHETRDRCRQSLKLYDCGGRDRGSFAGACHYSSMYPRRGAHPDARSRGYIDGLAVPENYQGRGLGRLLLLHTLHRIRAMDCESVSLTTAADNLRAQNLYYSLGFRLVDSCLSFEAPIKDLSARFGCIPDL